MTELFPGLHKLAGGKKQAWINQNLDFIAMLNDNLGFEETAKALHMKADTLSKALVKAERGHRPSVTRADKAYYLAQSACGKADTALGELAVQAEAIACSTEEVQELKTNLTSYFTLISKASELMARLCQSTHSNLTEHIRYKSPRKVGLTKRIGSSRLLLSTKKAQNKRNKRPYSRPFHFKRYPGSGGTP